jgi:hypothetical protein
MFQNPIAQFPFDVEKSPILRELKVVKTCERNVEPVCEEMLPFWFQTSDIKGGPKMKKTFDTIVSLCVESIVFQNCTSHNGTNSENLQVQV